MLDYIHLFETEEQFNSNYNGVNYKEPWVSYTIGINRVDYNKPNYVDLGLPSGTLWATCNLGASYPEEYGDYYAWGEIIPNKATAYTVNNYKWYNGSNYTKYTSGFNTTTLEFEDDAVNVVMGDQWHIPTITQCSEFINNVTSATTADYNGTGIPGVLFTSNINGNTIFFPAAGFIDGEGLKNRGDVYNVWSWSSTLGLFENMARVYRGDRINYSERYVGAPVRGVIDSLN